ncbi:ATP-binding protein [Streptomyces sp. CWNU-52B]|uniref:ATP-binding protein n=1 Tax=unclassified Streptomyces TaxID=2593676 RepID=UPI0039C07671
MAEPEEVSEVRRVLRGHLGLWDLEELIDAAQLCVSELVSNVITHVGPGTPSTLAVSMRGTRLRIEVHDPDTRALPTLVAGGADSETGRGLELITAMADRWGVRLLDDRKATWCELASVPAARNGDVAAPGVVRAEALLDLYAEVKLSDEPESTRLSTALAEEAVIDVITDFLHWLRAHGCDEEEILDRAQRRFDSQSATVVVS